MAAEERCWAGVDVGAAKGHDVAVIDAHGLLAGPIRIREAARVASWLEEQGPPTIVAVDSPISPAPSEALSRPCERELVRAGVCGIRYTPNARALGSNPAYYAWIEAGFRLYERLRSRASWRVIECFPTATWSRLDEPKGSRTRARWSREALDRLELQGLPGRTNQDARDAIGAAVTARLHDRGETESFGEIVVPRPGASLDRP